ncbi:hypothetical protein M438DRAFT_347165 [Aureobasidium pullulans EXF-150]|uniref:Uncharacterized protein n=1 Tax=Aureobasidium pullulans EXF-150 TaxID=1043002 RepID=A0A074XK15_AURPU|nr:uncharacterized protein M438DRAFT_347165 [Aureobasidium pullulans EXF-150]KEQ82377.1 hypothetical protein M438DRAFT_347165 [Aureobasidium pullulans EXF-150]
MCIQYSRKYSCGCSIKEEFRQCGKRSGTNVKCHPVEDKGLEKSGHYCRAHMVAKGSGNEEMKRVVK